MQKKILFRVDAGGQVGLGHYYRSLNLALTLKDRGYEILFVHQASEFWDNLKDFPFKHYELFPETAENDMISICRDQQAAVFYADGIIQFSPQFIQEIKKTAKVIFYQNLTDAKVLADVFILPSIHQDNAFFAPFENSGTVVYKGLEYFTFNKEIEKYDSLTFEKDKSVNKIAVTAGGSDPRNILLTLYEILDEGNISQQVEVAFFYGNDYLYKNNIPEKLKDYVSFLPYSTGKIVTYDLLIASFGVSAYEFMCLGMPVIGIGHQKSNAEALRILSAKTGAIYDLGLIDDLGKETFNATLNSLINNTEKLAAMSQKAKRILDTQGICRVVDILEKL